MFVRVSKEASEPFGAIVVEPGDGGALGSGGQQAIVHIDKYNKDII